MLLVVEKPIASWNATRRAVCAASEQVSPANIFVCMSSSTGNSAQQAALAVVWPVGHVTRRLRAAVTAHQFDVFPHSEERTAVNRRETCEKNE